MDVIQLLKTTRTHQRTRAFILWHNIYEVVLDGNMKVILCKTPYGTVLFWPLTKKIQRNCYMIDGDVQVYVHYLRWLILQWENRNPDINCVATTC